MIIIAVVLNCSFIISEPGVGNLCKNQIIRNIEKAYALISCHILSDTVNKTNSDCPIEGSFGFNQHLIRSCCTTVVRGVEVLYNSCASSCYWTMCLNIELFPWCSWPTSKRHHYHQISTCTVIFIPCGRKCV